MKNIKKNIEKKADMPIFGGQQMTSGKEVEGQISACLQRGHIYVLHTSAIG